MCRCQSTCQPVGGPARCVCGAVVCAGTALTAGGCDRLRMKHGHCGAQQHVLSPHTGHTRASSVPLSRAACRKRRKRWAAEVRSAEVVASCAGCAQVQKGGDVCRLSGGADAGPPGVCRVQGVPLPACGGVSRGRAAALLLRAPRARPLRPPACEMDAALPAQHP